MNETKPKKMVSRNVAIRLGIVCILVIALMAINVTQLSLSISELTKKYDRENTLASVWVSPLPAPSNINDLFQNNTVLWNDENVTEPARSNATFTFTNDYFTEPGCLLVNVSGSTPNPFDNWIEIYWTGRTTVGSFTSFSHTSISSTALFPILNPTSVQFIIGNDETGNGNVTQTVSMTYYY
jgi:hypothetical protein